MKSPESRGKKEVRCAGMSGIWMGEKLDRSAMSWLDERMDLLLTSQARVLAAVTRDPGARLRDLAQRVSLTERAVQRLVGELAEAGYLVRVREGRRVRYEVAVERLRGVVRALGALLPEGLAGLVAEDARPIVEALPSLTELPPVRGARGEGMGGGRSFVD